MRETIAHKLERDGFAVIENFLSAAEVKELREAGDELADTVPEDQQRTVFTTTQQCKNRYFIESADRISYFYEKDALAEDGSLQVEPRVALNKVGHALHELHPKFRRVTQSDRVREVCWHLNMKRPVVAQSMYIYKNPGLGGVVVPHQDATFLYTDPPSALVGFWIPLDDATLENGCLWMAPGSHKSGVHRRLMRNKDVQDPDKDEMLVFDRGEQIYPRSAFTALPVAKGSLVLIHGLVVHQSEPNKSSLARHAYTFHVVDLGRCTYSPDNWLQPSPSLPFSELYNKDGSGSTREASPEQPHDD